MAAVRAGVFFKCLLLIWQKTLYNRKINHRFSLHRWLTSPFYVQGGIKMGNKNIKKDEKKKKKADAKPVASNMAKPVAIQPEVIKKPKKEMKEHG